jgi:hypothetical protein
MDPTEAGTDQLLFAANVCVDPSGDVIQRITANGCYHASASPAINRCQIGKLAEQMVLSRFKCIRQENATNQSIANSVGSMLA